MATTSFRTGSALLLFVFFVKAFADNTSVSPDVQKPSSTSVTTKPTPAEADGVVTTQLGKTESPLNVPNETLMITERTTDATVSSVKPENDENNRNASVEMTSDLVETTQLRTTESPLNVLNETLMGEERTIDATVSSVKPGNYENNSNTSVKMTPVPPTTISTTNRQTPRPSTSKKTVDIIRWDAKWDEPFKHDYASLRNAGLTIAAVLFLVGIMVITCGKIKCNRHCQMHKGRSYDLTRM